MWGSIFLVVYLIPGLENLIVIEATKSAKLSISFVRMTKSRELSGELGPFEQLKNRNCDVILGEIPTVDISQICETSTYFLTDASVLVTPTFRCSRLIGLVMFTPETLVTSLGVLVGLYIFDGTKPRTRSKGGFKHKFYLFVKSNSAKIFATTPLLLLSVVVLGYIQAQLYDTLVREQQWCYVKNLGDIVKKKVITGVEPRLMKFLSTSLLPNVAAKSVMPYLIKNDNLKNMDPNKCHILREILFKYLVPKYYLTKSGHSKFKIVQSFNRRVYMLLLRKGYPFVKDINLGLLKVQQNGMNSYLEDQVCGRIHLKDIAKYSKLLSYFTPVQLPEIYWLLVFLLSMWMMALFVFLVEITLGRWFKNHH